MSPLPGVNGQLAMQQVGVWPFLFLLGASVLSSFVIAAIYVHFRGPSSTGTQIYRTFPLLGLSITAIFVIIQFSLPLSIGLLGALSLVRFRTPIKEPEEVGFLMIVVAAAIACATFKLQFLGILLLVTVAAAMVQSRLAAMEQRRDGVLVIAVPADAGAGRTAAIGTVVTKHLGTGQLEGLSRDDRQVVVSYAFQGLSPQALQALRLDLRREAADPALEVFFHPTT